MRRQSSVVMDVADPVNLVFGRPDISKYLMETFAHPTAQKDMDDSFRSGHPRTKHGDHHPIRTKRQVRCRTSGRIVSALMLGKAPDLGRSVGSCASFSAARLPSFSEIVSIQCSEGVKASTHLKHIDRLTLSEGKLRGVSYRERDVSHVACNARALTF